MWGRAMGRAIRGARGARREGEEGGGGGPVAGGVIRRVRDLPTQPLRPCRAGGGELPFLPCKLYPLLRFSLLLMRFSLSPASAMAELCWGLI